LLVHWVKGLEMRLSILAIAVCVGACALQRGLTADTAASLKHRQLTTTVRRAPALYVVVAGMPPLGLAAAIGTSIARSEAGLRLVRENEIQDPAFKIAEELGERLRRVYDVRASTPVLGFVDDDPTKISQATPAADLVLDVWTDNWSMEPFTSDDPQYRVRYLVNIRLIDAKGAPTVDGRSGVVLAEGTCRCVSEDESLAATYDELVADHARRLKNELETAVEVCVEDFSSRVLALAPAP
jgi:hypothetical protein